MMPTAITIDRQADQLQERLSQYGSQYGPIVVAFSGGVDSSVVAAAAFRTNPQTIAVTAVSPSVASWQQTIAGKVAAEIGINHCFLETDELSNPAYRRNDGQRCFHCKTTLYHAIHSIAQSYSQSTIVSGTNQDDLGDYRPGLQAGKRANVQTPLADLRIDKSTVRKLAAHYGLSNRALPASPCLASRIAYGIEVTQDRLSRIDKAESLIRQAGFDDVRVRCESAKDQPGDVARIEVPPADVDRLHQVNSNQQLTHTIQSMGFEQVTIDPRGLRSGNLNEAIGAGKKNTGLPHTNRLSLPLIQTF